MSTPKLSIPSPQYILNIAIALLIIAAVARFVPESVKQYFRI